MPEPTIRPPTMPEGEKPDPSAGWNLLQDACYVHPSGKNMRLAGIDRTLLAWKLLLSRMGRTVKAGDHPLAEPGKPSLQCRIPKGEAARQRVLVIAQDSEGQRSHLLSAGAAASFAEGDMLLLVQPIWRPAPEHYAARADQASWQIRVDQDFAGREARVPGELWHGGGWEATGKKQAQRQQGAIIPTWPLAWWEDQTGKLTLGLTRQMRPLWSPEMQPNGQPAEPERVARHWRSALEDAWKEGNGQNEWTIMPNKLEQRGWRPSEVEQVKAAWSGQGPRQAHLIPLHMILSWECSARVGAAPKARPAPEIRLEQLPERSGGRDEFSSMKAEELSIRLGARIEELAAHLKAHPRMQQERRIRMMRAMLRGDSAAQAAARLQHEDIERGRLIREKTRER